MLGVWTWFARPNSVLARIAGQDARVGVFSPGNLALAKTCPTRTITVAYQLHLSRFTGVTADTTHARCRDATKIDKRAPIV